MTGLSEAILVQMREQLKNNPTDSLLNYHELFALVQKRPNQTTTGNAQALQRFRNALRMLSNSGYLREERMHGVSYFGLTSKGQSQAERLRSNFVKKTFRSSTQPKKKKASADGSSGCGVLILLLVLLAVVIFLAGQR